jgi:hypothetical protein
MGTHIPNYFGAKSSRVARRLPRFGSVSSNSAESGRIDGDVIGSGRAKRENENGSIVAETEPDQLLSEFLSKSQSDELSSFECNKRSRSADVCRLQTRHQRQILEALTPTYLFPAMPCVENSATKCPLNSRLSDHHETVAPSQINGSMILCDSNRSCHSLIEPTRMLSFCSSEALTAYNPPKSSPSVQSQESSCDSSQRPGKRKMDGVSRYGSIPSLLSALDGEHERGSAAAASTQDKAANRSSREQHDLDAEEEAIALLMKYTHVSGGPSR